MDSVVLSDTSLCAIVRDEKMNSAGGIERFVDSHVPYVEQAIIADTGSIDGTREILEEMQSKYSNLKVVDVPFNGYSDARNKSLKHVKTKRVLILDADELLTHEKPQNDWKILSEFIENNYSEACRFFFEQIYPHKIISDSISGHTLRLFDKNIKLHFENDLWEQAEISKKCRLIRIENVLIKHFLPSHESTKLKWENWYLEDINAKYCAEDRNRVPYWKKISPSMTEGFSKWKKYNPLRDNYV